MVEGGPVMFLVIHGVGTDGRPSVNHVFGKGSPTWDRGRMGLDTG